MKSRIYLYFCILFFIPRVCFLQEIETIKISKPKSQIYFFQKGFKSDTITANQTNFFYLIVPDSLKQNTVLLVENGRLIADKNDSIVSLQFLQGLKYGSTFLLQNEVLNPDKKRKSNLKTGKPKYDFVSYINGASNYPGNKILIQLINKKENYVLLENVFYFK